MPSNEQRRQAAKNKLERKLAQREQKARRRRITAVSTTIVVVVAAVVGVFYFTHTSSDEKASGDPDPAAKADSAARTQPTSGPCHYTPTPKQDSPKSVGLPKDPKPTPAQGTVPVSVRTNQGAIDLTLDRGEAPCTVQSFVHLAKSEFFDGTNCHRLTTGRALKVLQCGDPTGTGKGGPGYKFADELPKNLETAPEKFQSPRAEKKSAVYPRGTLAMANSGPDTNGSQFFMVYEKSYLPPNYTVFGHISEQGLQVLDKVAAQGVKPGTKSEPKLPVTIERATVEA